DNRIPVTIGLSLILGDNLKRESFAVFEGGAPVEAEAGYFQHRKLDCQHLSLLAVRVIARGAVDRGYGAVWKSLGVEPSGFFCCAVVPKANYVFRHRLSLLVRQSAGRSELRRKSATEIDRRPKRTYGHAPAKSAIQTHRTWRKPLRRPTKVDGA